MSLAITHHVTVGETPATRNGYRVRVSSLVFGAAGPRMRITLMQNDALVKFLDLTPELARELRPLIAQAIDLGRWR